VAIIAARHAAPMWPGSPLQAGARENTSSPEGISEVAKAWMVVIDERRSSICVVKQRIRETSSPFVVLSLCEKCGPEKLKLSPHHEPMRVLLVS
jgi:hypothetical protein